MSKEKLYQKAWFWIIVAVTILLMTFLIVNSVAPTYQNKYKECKSDYDRLVQLNKDYFQALDNYCEFSPDNPLFQTQS